MFIPKNGYLMAFVYGFGAAYWGPIIGGCLDPGVADALRRLRRATSQRGDRATPNRLASGYG